MSQNAWGVEWGNWTEYSYYPVYTTREIAEQAWNEAWGHSQSEIAEMCDETSRKAKRLAPRVYESAMDSGCTDTRPNGPRQAKAWDLVALGYQFNALLN